MIRSIVKSMVRPIVSDIVSGGGSITPLAQRYFISFDPVAHTHGQFLEPYVFTGDFEIEFDFVTSNPNARNISGATSNSRYEILINNYRFLIWDGFNNTAVITVTDVNHLFDGRLHQGRVVRSGNSHSLYIDNVLLGTGTSNIGDLVIDRIGHRGNSSGNFFDGILANIKLTDLSGSTPVTDFYPIDTLSNSETSNGNTLTLNNVDHSETELVTFDEDNERWVGENRAHQILEDWPIKNASVTQNQAGVFDVAYTGVFTNILRDSNMFSLNDDVLWSVNVSNYTDGEAFLFIGNSSPLGYSSNGEYAGLSTASVTDGRYQHASSGMNMTLSELSAKRIINIAPQA